jgi:CubicO group peptidase (beta-lactamase class C family)
VKTVKPESVGLSSARLEVLDEHIARRYVDSGKLPGTLLLVARRGQLAHVHTAGMRDREQGLPVNADTIFRLHSLSKPLTTVGFMMLVERGLVALDDPVHKFIPQWQGIRALVPGDGTATRASPASRPLLIVDLLRHTSGLTYSFQNRSAVDAAYRELGIDPRVRSGSLTTMIERLATVPLQFAPGSAWNYSVSTDVLGYLIERLAERPFARYLREEVLLPLGMWDTDFQVAPANASRLASCYQLKEGRMQLEDAAATSEYLEPPAFASGGGGLLGTAADYLRFCLMLRNGGSLDGVRLLGAKTLQLMTANHLPEGKDLHTLSQSMFSEVSYAGVGFGLGFAVTLDPVKCLIAGSVGDYFWGGGAGTYFWVDPAEDLIVVFMTQLAPSSAYPIRRELRTLIYAALEGGARS